VEPPDTLIKYFSYIIVSDQNVVGWWGWSLVLTSVNVGVVRDLIGVMVSDESLACVLVSSRLSLHPLFIV